MDNTFDPTSSVLAYLSFALILIALLIIYRWIGNRSKGLDYANQWRAIQSTFREGSAGQKLAVSDADKLLDQALKQLGFRGDTMGERLKSARKSLGTQNNAAWSAHKLRNKLVHEADFSPSKNQCSRALGDFKKSLKQLGVNL